MAKRSADLVASWEAFCEREHGFLPPKFAAMYLGITTPGLYSAADRGKFRYHVVASTRYYSWVDVHREKESRDARFINSQVKPVDRFLQRKFGHEPVLIKPGPCPEIVNDWFFFLHKMEGAFPSLLAGMRLKIQGQSVLAAHRAGWIRAFRVGREHFFAKKDVVDYWWRASRKNGDNKQRPVFKDRQIFGEGIR